MTVRPEIGSSSGFIPLRVKTSVLAAGPGVMTYVPSEPVSVLFPVSLTVTVTPLRGRSLRSVTLPFIVTRDCCPMEVRSINAINDTIVFMSLMI